jgi:hypothetical protein
MRLTKTLSIVALSILGATITFNWQEASAHRTSSSLTTMVWIDTEQSFEITHRLHLHDVQQALRNVIADPSTTIFDVKGQAELILYMDETFTAASTGGPIALEPIGAEVEGDYVYVYQEAKLTALPAVLSITDITFHDIYGEQENQVNLEYNNQVTSLVFNVSENTAKVVKLAKAP